MRECNNRSIFLPDKLLVYYLTQFTGMGMLSNPQAFTARDWKYHGVFHHFLAANACCRKGKFMSTFQSSSSTSLHSCTFGRGEKRDAFGLHKTFHFLISYLGMYGLWHTATLVFST